MDFVTDNNPVGLWKVDALVPAPAYVESAEVITKEATTSLASVAFANPLKREFPVHTKAATWLSAAYFYGSGFSQPKIEAAITKAATLHGIAEDVERIRTKVAEQRTKTASTAELPAHPTHALKVDFGKEVPGGQKQAFYPIRNLGEVIGSNEQVVADMSRLSVPQFREAATNIVKAAAVHGLETSRLHPKIVQAGTPRIFDETQAMKSAEVRGLIVKDPEVAQLYVDIVKAAAASPDEQAQCAELWLELDQQHRIKYAKGVLDPFEAFFSGITVAEFDKIANETVFVAGVAVPRSAVMGLPPTKVAAFFAGDVRAGVEATIKAASTSAADADKAAAALPPESQRELLRILVQS